MAAVALGVLWVTAGDDDRNPSAWMFRGGLVLACVLAAVVIAGVAQPDAGGLGRMLSVGPLRWVGGISYGIYLWHWPVYVLMTDVTTGLGGSALLVARLAATLGAATASFYLLERPVRRHRWNGLDLPRRHGPGRGGSPSPPSSLSTTGGRAVGRSRRRDRRS